MADRWSLLEPLPRTKVSCRRVYSIAEVQLGSHRHARGSIDFPVPAAL